MATGLMLYPRFRAEDDNGDPLSGGLAYFYEPNSLTPKNTYTTSALSVANANPVVLDSRGEADVWGSGKYRIITKTSAGVTIDDTDNVEGIGGLADQTSTQWVDSGTTPVYSSATQFTVAGDFTSVFQVGRRVQVTVNAGTLYGRVTARSYSSPTTTVTVSLDSGSLDSGLSDVNVGILTTMNRSFPAIPAAETSRPAWVLPNELWVDTDFDTNILALYLYDGTDNILINTINTSANTLGIFKLAKGSDVASAATLTLGNDGNFFDVTGNTGITAIATKGVGTVVTLQFDAALKLTHHATDLKLPGEVDFITRAGDKLTIVEYASGDWEVINVYRYGSQPAEILSNYASGIAVASAADTDHDITFSACRVEDSEKKAVMVLASAITKQIDASWAVGTNQGGMFTGSVGNSTWYHLFLIQKDSDGSIDAGFDTSITAANKPAGYTRYKYRGSVLTDGSANIIGFFQIYNKFIWTAKTLDFDEVIDSASPETKTLRVPTGVYCMANVNLHCDQFLARVYYTGETNAAAAETTAPLGMTGDITNYNASNSMVLTNTSGQVKAQTSNGEITRCATQYYENLAMEPI